MAARIKKELSNHLLYHIERTRLSPQKDGHLADRDGRVNLHQRGSAVMITGFTSDLRLESNCFLVLNG